MDYEKQLEAFYSNLNYNPISANAMTVYQAILFIAHTANKIEQLSIANTRLMSICNLTLKQFQAARNEILTKKYIDYKKGRNQNDAPKYAVSILYGHTCSKIGQPEGQAEGMAQRQPHRQAEGMALGYINTLHYITTLDLFFNYINNSTQDFFENEKDKINLQDKAIIVMHLKRLRYFSRR